MTKKKTAKQREKFFYFYHEKSVEGLAELECAENKLGRE